MRRSWYMQTDDAPSYDGAPAVTRGTCCCANPSTLWRTQGDVWECTICNQMIRGDARAKLKLEITGKPMGPAELPRTRPSRNAYAEDQRRDAPKIKACAAHLLDELSEWGAFIWNEASTGSKYLKFPHWGLGSITIRNHNVIEKYAYKWVVRVDMGVQGRGNIYSPDELDRLVADFVKNAESRDIRPGDKQTWDEYNKRETPDWKKRLFDKNQKELRR